MIVVKIVGDANGNNIINEVFPLASICADIRHSADLRIWLIPEMKSDFFGSCSKMMLIKNVWDAKGNRFILGHFPLAVVYADIRHF